MTSEPSDLPEADVVIDHLALSEPELHIAMKAVVKQLLPHWASIPDTDIEIAVVSGGISNALYKLSPTTLTEKPAETTDSTNPILLRVYGVGTEKFVDRHKEVGVMRLLRSNGFGPAVLGLFTNGRIESYLPLRCLTPEEMAEPTVAAGIAATLARFHAVDATHAPKTANTPFQRIREWLKIAKDLDFSDDPKKAAAHAALDFGALEAAVGEVEAAAALLHSPIVFSHNDLLSGNIMADADALAAATTAAGENGVAETAFNSFSPATMTFIDFEYADWAPRGFDLGNHFCEYAGFECDYGRYPDGTTARAFLRSYLAAANNCSLENVSEKEIDVAVADANVHALAAHQYWGTWALMQARWSVIDFDYMGYAALRWGEFERRKEEFLGQARAVAAAAGTAVTANGNTA